MQVHRYADMHYAGKEVFKYEGMKVCSVQVASEQIHKYIISTSKIKVHKVCMYAHISTQVFKYTVMQCASMQVCKHASI